MTQFIDVVVVVTLFPAKIHENTHMYNTLTVVSPQNVRMYFVSGCQKKLRLIELAAAMLYKFTRPQWVQQNTFRKMRIVITVYHVRNQKYLVAYIKVWIKFTAKPLNWPLDQEASPLWRAWEYVLMSWALGLTVLSTSEWGGLNIRCHSTAAVLWFEDSHY